MTDASPQSPAVSEAEQKVGWQLRAAVKICRDVAELSDRTSPDDNADMMLVTADELLAIVTDALASRPSPERREIVEECAKVADDLADRWDNSLSSLEAADMGTSTTLAVMQEAINGVRAVAAVIRSLADTNAGGTPACWQSYQIEKIIEAVTTAGSTMRREDDGTLRTYYAGYNLTEIAKRLAEAFAYRLPVSPSPPAGEWQPRPVAFRVKNRAGEWCLFQHEEIAQAAADHLGVEYQGLYARASTPVESGKRGED